MLVGSRADQHVQGAKKMCVDLKVTTAAREAIARRVGRPKVPTRLLPGVAFRVNITGTPSMSRRHSPVVYKASGAHRIS